MVKQPDLAEQSDSGLKDWPEGLISRIPYWVYSDPDVYRREQERIFDGPHWSYVGLTIEIPKAGDFKSTFIGERPVVVVRNREGRVSVFENHCPHRGIKFCQKDFGNASKIICPYHQWTFNLDGKLLGVPFKRGVKGQGGMPEDFNTEDHGLRKLQVTERNGVIFASFDPKVPNLEEYLGERMLGYFDRVFNGRELKLLGYLRQRIPANWKLMHENIKDPYHTALMHVFFVTFGLFRADHEGAMEIDETGRHATLVTKGSKEGHLHEATAGVDTFKEGMKLNDRSIIDVVEEGFWNGYRAVIQSLFPNVIIYQNMNSLGTRQILPRGAGSFDFVWTLFGFADDSEEMTQRRLRHASLFGPSGYVSMDDGEVLAMAQRGLETFPDMMALAELGGKEACSADHVITETAIRSLYKYYQTIMKR